ncbi:hypothetical protein [Pseudoduganella namucuonensis]|uniref:Uncharacterized protein n=1 Tax=Pseudoduganella namucuonensis TaxID=1035707 RepID=A0A1I7KNZ5_9BURK|nr:hypothetical protein [Pseudoduganella namucuonensis]SFU99141.1 hypothetical protein SAMN05216552_101877 [Pseudoduganella namucuonensis]
MKTTFLAAAAAAMLGLAGAAIAAPDEAQRQAIQRAMAAKDKLREAEAAKGAERAKLMGEHMRMMKEVMDGMRAMEPRPGTTVQEREEWMREHQQLMRQMMDQMMAEHHMMMKGHADGKKPHDAEKRDGQQKDGPEHKH